MPTVLIRIVKSLPAPLMDGFDVSRFRVRRIYDVDQRVGRYLLTAGYAVPVDQQADDTHRKRRRPMP